MFRGPHTPEARARIAAANAGRSHTPEARQKITAANSGRTHSLETRIKRSASRGKIDPVPAHLWDDYQALIRKRFSAAEARAIVAAHEARL